MRCPSPVLSLIIAVQILCLTGAAQAQQSLPPSQPSQPAQAGGAPIGADQFDAITRGRTLTYAAGGRIYGTEQYLPGHQVLWAFTGDECKKGHWFPRGQEICFQYDDVPELQCWTFYNTADGLSARFHDDPGSEPLVAVQDSTEPLACLAPNLGA